MLGGGVAIGLGTLVFFQLFYVFNCRSEELNPFSAGLLANPQLVGAILLCALLQLSVTYVPRLAFIFDSVPPSPPEMAVSLAVAASPLGAGRAARLWQTGHQSRGPYVKV